jgi:hypothetical protein
MQIDAGNAVGLALCCGLLCVGGVVVLLALQLITGLLDAVMSVVGLAFGAVTGDPLSCCGCVVVLLVCGGCALAALVFAGMCGGAGAPGVCSILGL